MFAVHGLDFPGSPWDRGTGYVDVLRFQVPLSEYVHDAAGPEFADRPPFTGTGFAVWSGGVVSVYFLDECAIPPGAELWRIRAGVPEELLAVYFEVATGWGVAGTSGISRPGVHTPSHIIGWSAVWQGQVFRADLADEGRSVEVAATSDPGIPGFEQTPKGCWRRTVGLGEIQNFYELLATCRWQASRSGSPTLPRGRKARSTGCSIPGITLTGRDPRAEQGRCRCVLDGDAGVAGAGC